MAITFRASSGFTVASGSSTTTQAVTIAASVAFGDVVLLEVVCLPVTTTTPPVLTVQSSTGTTPVKDDAATGFEPLPASVSGTVFHFIASASDAGKVITFQSTIAGFWAISGAAYSGENTSVPISVISVGGAFGGASTASVTCPTITAINPSGSLAVFMGGGAAEGGGLTSPAGSTTRATIVSGSDVASAITDSNSVTS